MNNVERALLEQMENEKFQKVVSDDFSFVDSLTDQKDLDKNKNNKEDGEDGCND